MLCKRATPPPGHGRPAAGRAAVGVRRRPCPPAGPAAGFSCGILCKPRAPPAAPFPGPGPSRTPPRALCPHPIALSPVSITNRMLVCDAGDLEDTEVERRRKDGVAEAVIARGR